MTAKWHKEQKKDQQKSSSYHNFPEWSSFAIFLAV